MKPCGVGSSALAIQDCLALSMAATHLRLWPTRGHGRLSANSHCSLLTSTVWPSTRLGRRAQTQTAL